MRRAFGLTVRLSGHALASNTARMAAAVRSISAAVDQFEIEMRIADCHSSIALERFIICLVPTMLSQTARAL